MRKHVKLVLTGAIVLGLAFSIVSCGKVSPNKLSSEFLYREGNPLVGFRILLNVGSVNDPAGKEGLCTLALSMLANGGSQSLTFKEIQKKFYPMATSVGLSVEKEMSVFTGTVHVDNLEKYYAIFKDMLLAPGFHEDDFKRIKTNQLNFLEKTLVSNMDEQFGKEILNLLMYEGHPYGHHEAGTLETLKAQTLSEILGWKMDSKYYGHKDFLAEVQKRLPQITHEDVNRAIKKYLNFENLYIALITQDAESFKEALVNNTPSPITYAIPNMPEDILEEDKIYQVFPLDVKPENVRVVQATSFFQKEGVPKK
ncbi:hypothetical protein ES703_80758 [subsurface metagenome]|nr:hypothetical protein [bacterium]